MPSHRRKPVVVEAFRLGQRGQPTPAPAWFGSPDFSRITDDGIIVITPTGVAIACWGDWIVRATPEVFVIVKDDIFRSTYEVVPD